MEPIFDLTTFQAIREWKNKHPSATVRDWPGWICNGGDVNSMEGYSPACQYAVDFVRAKHLGEVGMKCQCVFCPFAYANITGKECHFDLDYAEDFDDDSAFTLRPGVKVK